MNTDIQIFNFQDNALRVIADDDGNPWFIAKEVAEILGYKDTEAMTRRLDDDEVQNLQIVGFGNRGVNVINESGLYSSILGSNKPAAKIFKKIVTAEILPAIRKAGFAAVMGQLAEAQLKLTHTVPASSVVKLLGQYTDLVSRHTRMDADYTQLVRNLESHPSALFGKPRPWTADEDKKAIHLYLNGYGYTRIGYALGRSQASVKARFDRKLKAAVAALKAQGMAYFDGEVVK